MTKIPSIATVLSHNSADNNNEITTRQLKYQGQRSFPVPPTSMASERWYQRFVAAQIADLRSPVFWSEVVAETVASALLGCFVTWIAVTLNTQSFLPSAAAFAALSACYVSHMIDATGAFGFNMFNPIVSWASFLNGRITLSKMILYHIAEYGGTVGGGMIAFWLTPESIQSTYGPVPMNEGLTVVQVMLIEAIVSFNLVFAGLSISSFNSKNTNTPGITIGLAIFVGAFAAGTRTGGIMCPSLTLMIGVTSNNFSNQWPFHVGEYLGATVAALFNKALVTVRQRYSNHKDADDLQQKPETNLEPNSKDFSQSVF